MEKNELERILSILLVPNGFKKKASSWKMVGEEITKMVFLQKSRYGNFFCVNYGYNLHSLPLDGLKTHVFFGLGTENPIENERIKELLNLENTLPDLDRSKGLTEQLAENLVKKMNLICTEGDLLEELKRQENLNLIPLLVKQHFKLAD
jgi:hypothetical protein